MARYSSSLAARPRRKNRNENARGGEAIRHHFHRRDAKQQRVKGLVETNEKGFIITGTDLIRDGKRPKGWTLDRDPFMLETSVPGIFAAGDVRFGANNRVASATGEGGVAIAAIQRYLSTL
jgi:thioredoxin reductase